MKHAYVAAHEVSKAIEHSDTETCFTNVYEKVKGLKSGLEG
jgi:hypothetical protein